MKNKVQPAAPTKNHKSLSAEEKNEIIDETVNIIKSEQDARKTTETVVIGIICAVICLAVAIAYYFTNIQPQTATITRYVDASYSSVVTERMVNDGKYSSAKEESSDIESGAETGQEVYSKSEEQLSKININSASATELMSLTGIGETKAKAIIKYRETEGSFASVEDIMKVSGIGEKTFEKIKDNITV